MKSEDIEEKYDSVFLMLLYSDNYQEAGAFLEKNKEIKSYIKTRGWSTFYDILISRNKELKEKVWQENQSLKKDFSSLPYEVKKKYLYEIVSLDNILFELLSAQNKETLKEISKIIEEFKKKYQNWNIVFFITKLLKKEKKVFLYFWSINLFQTNENFFEKIFLISPMKDAFELVSIFYKEKYDNAFLKTALLEKLKYQFLNKEKISLLGSFFSEKKAIFDTKEIQTYSTKFYKKESTEKNIQLVTIEKFLCCEAACNGVGSFYPANLMKCLNDFSLDSPNFHDAFEIFSTMFFGNIMREEKLLEGFVSSVKNINVWHLLKGYYEHCLSEVNGDEDIARSQLKERILEVGSIIHEFESNASLKTNAEEDSALNEVFSDEDEFLFFAKALRENPELKNEQENINPTLFGQLKH